MLYARSTNALWRIRRTEFEKLPQEKIIELYEMIFNKKHDRKNLVSDYKKPKLEIMSCGHHARYIVQADEGTAWCVMCEYSAMNDLLEKIRTLLTQEL
jgi:hypothetical protein